MEQGVREESTNWKRVAHMLLPCCKPIKHLLRYEEKGKIFLVHPIFTPEQATNQP